jgi:hypothetical protein
VKATGECISSEIVYLLLRVVDLQPHPRPAFPPSPLSPRVACAGVSNSNSLFAPPSHFTQTPEFFQELDTVFVFVAIYSNNLLTGTFGVSSPGTDGVAAFARVDSHEHMLVAHIGAPQRVDIVLPDRSTSAQVSFPPTKLPTSVHLLVMNVVEASMPDRQALNSWLSYLACTGDLTVVEVFSHDSAPFFRQRAFVSGFFTGSLFWNGEQVQTETVSPPGAKRGFLCQVDKKTGLLLRKNGGAAAECSTLQIGQIGSYLQDFQVHNGTIMATLRMAFSNGAAVGTPYSVGPLPYLFFRWDGDDTHVVEIRYSQNDLEPVSMIKLIGRARSASICAPTFALHSQDISWTTFTRGSSTFQPLPPDAYTPLDARPPSTTSGFLTHHRVLRGAFRWAENYTASHMSYMCDHCPLSPTKSQPGVCGCDRAEDVGNPDGDMAVNCFDGCPLVLWKWRC